MSRISPARRLIDDEDDEDGFAAVSSALHRRREDLFGSEGNKKVMVSGHSASNGLHHPTDHHNGHELDVRRVKVSDAAARINGTHVDPDIPPSKKGVTPPVPPSRSVLSKALSTKMMDFSAFASTKTATAQAYVGFANIPNQVYRRAIKQGFDFTLMVVGQSGLGKSTFINSLFLTEVYPGATVDVVRSLPATVRVETHPVYLVEKDVSLNLTLVDTPGYGDAIDNSKCWDPVIEFVDRKYLDYFTEETKVQRKERIADHRVHLCLYFIAPTGHGLKQLDVEFMKRLHERVNVVPVIAKADTMTPDELSRFKKQILKEIQANNIKVYQFPDPEDEDDRKEMQKLKDRVPFAVVGSNMVKDGEGGKKVRYREYAWGTVEVENAAHNDFLALRDMIIRSNLIDLIDVTRGVHYENFRFRQLTKVAKTSLDGDPFTQMEQDKQSKERELAARKADMEKVFREKVSERERKIADREDKLDRENKENQLQLESKKAELKTLQTAVDTLRRNNPSMTSLPNSDHSPPDSLSLRLNKTKKSSTLGSMFGRNKDE